MLTFVLKCFYLVRQEGNEFSGNKNNALGGGGGG